MRHDFFNRCLVWRIPRELDSVIETIFRVSSRHLSLNHPTVKRLLRASNNLDTSFANYPFLRSIYQKKKKKFEKNSSFLKELARNHLSPFPFSLYWRRRKGRKKYVAIRAAIFIRHGWDPRGARHVASDGREKCSNASLALFSPARVIPHSPSPSPPPSRLAAESRRSANLETSRFGK